MKIINTQQLILIFLMYICGNIKNMAKRGKKGVHLLYDKLTSMEVGEQFNTDFIHSHQTYAHGRARAMNKKFRTFRVNDVLTVIRIA